MKTKWTHLLIGGLAAALPALAAAEVPHPLPMVVQNLSGTLHVQQGLPLWCGELTKTTPVTAGRIELAPAGGQEVPGGRRFVLARANVSFAPFALSASCAGFSGTRTYEEVGVEAARATSFIGTPSSPDVFTVTIPKDDVLIYEASIADGLLEQGYTPPRQDVTGTIDLENRTLQMQVVVGTTVHFKEGCVNVCWPVGDCEVCAIDEQKDGTLTAMLSGTIAFPDTDGDGIPDPDDPCPMFPNRAQEPVAPLIRVFPEVTLDSCASARLGPTIGIDVCRDLPIEVTDDAPDVFRPGANVVTYTAVDAQGVAARAQQAVNVVDATPPVFTSVPGDITLDDCGPAELGLPTVEDDCGGTPTLTHDAPRSFAVGRTAVTWTATDSSGNRAAATQTVSVTDTVAPEVSCVAERPDLFRVASADGCTALPAIRLGPYALTNGDIVQIVETGRSGVTLIEDGKGKLFLVGPGEAVITATDDSGNVAAAACPVPASTGRRPLPRPGAGPRGD